MKRYLLCLATLSLQATPVFSQDACFPGYEVAPICQITSVKAPKFHCSKAGTVNALRGSQSTANPWGAGHTCSAPSEADCSAACNSSGYKCKAYAYDTATGICSLFAMQLKAKDFTPDETSTTRFSRKNCATESRLVEKNRMVFSANWAGTDITIIDYPDDLFEGGDPKPYVPVTTSLDGVAQDDACTAANECLAQGDGSPSAAYVYFSQSTSTWICQFYPTINPNDFGFDTTNNDDIGMSYLYFTTPYS